MFCLFVNALCEWNVTMYPCAVAHLSTIVIHTRQLQTVNHLLQRGILQS